MPTLFDPIVLGEIECRNRIAMAPCTRCMSPNFLPTEDVVRYYERRARDGVGLLISEGTVICHRGAGHLGVPGIFLPEHEEAWRRVTDAVHGAGGRMICQIWHVGAVAHPRTTGGALPESPSGISPEGHLRRLLDENGRPEPFGPSEAMSHERVVEVIDLFRQATARSLRSGFDGVEIHGAHSYLVDQFTNPALNRREDEYGVEDRTRFAREVTRAVIEEAGAGRVTFRFSPRMSVSGTPWAEAEKTFGLLLDALDSAGLRILHASNQDYDEAILKSDPDRAEPDQPLHRATRARWSGQLIGVGSLTPERANAALSADEVDMVAFGRSLIANPDFCTRLKEDRPLREYDPAMLDRLE
jgi:N-ethylmaleimide reductase